MENYTYFMLVTSLWLYIIANEGVDFNFKVVGFRVWKILISVLQHFWPKIDLGRLFIGIRFYKNYLEIINHIFEFT